MSLAGFLGAGTIPQLLAAAMFYPLSIYFLVQIIPQRKKAVPTLSEISDLTSHKEHAVEVLEAEAEPDTKVRFDKDRRMFIKLIGSAGVTVFLFSLFTKKAEAAFFGSVPGPGTVALKNTSGTPIDPAEKSPTDGYNISQVDGDSSPAYYGYLDKNSNWYIIKEDTNGSYLYAKGASGFSTAWGNRNTSLSYGTFDSVF